MEDCRGRVAVIQIAQTELFKKQRELLKADQSKDAVRAELVYLAQRNQELEVQIRRVKRDAHLTVCISLLNKFLSLEE